MARVRCLKALVPLAVVACAALGNAQNLLSNPSFEAGPTGLNLTSVPGWIVTGNFTSFGDPAVDICGPLGPDPSAYAQAASGKQFCELVATPGFGSMSDVKVTQTVATIPGKRYVLAASFSRHFYYENEPVNLNVYVGSQSRTISHAVPSVSRSSMKWRRFRLSFTATSSTTTIGFGDGGSSWSYGGANVDDVVLVSADQLRRKRKPGKRRGDLREDLLCEDESMSAEYEAATGDMLLTFEDPVPTRGYPLKNNVAFSSSAFEANKGLGNFTFSYDIRLKRDQDVANEAGQVSKAWMLFDGDGSTFVCGTSEFGQGPDSGPGMFSQLIANGTQTVFFLDRAGPPGRLDEAGHFNYEFDASGRLTVITDPSGNRQFLSYTNGVLSQVVDAATGKSIRTEIVGGKIRKFIENGGSIVTSFTYSGDRLSQMSVASDVETVRHDFTYDGLGRLSSVMRDGQKDSKMTLAYAAVGVLDPVAPLYSANVKTGEGSTGAKWGLPSILPDLADAYGSVRRASSKGVTDYELDAGGRIIGVLHPLKAGQAQRKLTKLRYSEEGLPPIEEIDDVSISSRIFNNDGQLVDLVINDVYGQFGNRYQFQYANLNLTSIRDNLGTMVELTYGNPLTPNRPTKVRDAQGSEWNLAYNIFGQVITVQEPGAFSSSQLDYWESGQSVGLLERLTNGAGNEIRVLDYNLAGDPTRIETSPSPGVFVQRQLTYDALHRVTSLTHDDGKRFRWAYLGRYLDQSIDEAGTITRYTHCKSCGKLVGVSGPLGWKLGWTYDGDGDLRVFTDARGNATNYTYGAGRELTRVTYPDGSAINWTYGLYVHPQGRSDKRTNARGQVTQIYYDQQGRDKRRDHLTSNFAGEFFEYNVDGSLKTAIEGGAVVSDSLPVRRFTYWPNRLVRTMSYRNQTWGLTTTQTLEYDYNPDRTISQMRWKTGASVACIWNYSYDGAGRLTGVSTNLGDGATFGYDGEGKLTSQVNQNGTSRSLSYYEPRGWISSATDRKGAQTIGSYAVQFDGGQNTVGNITRVTDHLGQIVNYTYDPLYRLTGETHTGGSAYQRTYAYDLAGNLNQVNGSTVATYDAANKISTVVGGMAAHDADGNLTAISGPGITPYSNSVFNDFDDLRSFSVNGKSVQYRYDYLGKRTVKIVNGVAESFFIYSGDQLIGEVNRDGTIRSVYTWGADGLVSERRGADIRYFHYGPQGEVRQVSDAAGNVVGTLRYNAYGVPLEVMGSVSASVRFGGKNGYYTDADSGLIRCGARWYSPELNRWISRDPSGYDGGPNLYGYCKQSPLSWFDATGRAPMPQHQSGLNEQQVEANQALCPDGNEPEDKRPMDPYEKPRDEGVVESDGIGPLDNLVPWAKFPRLLKTLWDLKDLIEKQSELDDIERRQRR